MGYKLKFQILISMKFNWGKNYSAIFFADFFYFKKDYFFDQDHVTVEIILITLCALCVSFVVFVNQRDHKEHEGHTKASKKTAQLV